MERLSGRPSAWDTSAAIYFLEQIEPYHSILRGEFQLLREQGGSVVLSVVVYHELLVGPWRSGDMTALARVVRFCRRPPIELAPLTAATARISARLRATTGLPTPDSLIIASARTAGCAEIVGNDARWRGRALGVAYRHLGDAARTS